MTNASLRPKQPRHVADYECPADSPAYVPPISIQLNSSSPEAQRDEVNKVESSIEMRKAKIELEDDAEDDIGEDLFMMPSCAQTVKEEW
jgi:hypothetical protein